MEGLFSFLVFAGFFYFMMRFGCGAHMVHGHAGHGGHEHESAVAAGSATDPVCNMSVAVDQGYTKMHQDRQYRFCSRTCLDKFDADPKQYLALRKGVR